jgi:hypothetical protein
MLNKVSDRNGNNYVVSYNNTGGFAVPDVISWTPTSLGAGTYQYEAKFNYWTGRSNADSYFGSVANYSITNRYRLESIQIKSGGVVKRKYRFGYGISTVTSRSQLTSAKECADDAESNCFLPLTFSYQTGQAGVTAGAATPPAGSSNNLIKGRYDFNGDGKDDIAYWSSTTWYVALSTGSGFAGPYNTGLTATSALADAFLPNGRASLIGSVSGHALELPLGRCDLLVRWRELRHHERDAHHLARLQRRWAVGPGVLHVELTLAHSAPEHQHRQHQPQLRQHRLRDGDAFRIEGLCRHL